MENPLHIAEPDALARPRGAHRFEAFSPKLTRRMTFYCRALLEQWVLLEADPRAITFCERPVTYSSMDAIVLRTSGFVTLIGMS